jgi:serine/threonine protein kinase
MAAPATVDEFLDLIHKSGVADEKRLDAYVQKLRNSGSLPAEPSKLAGLMVRDGVLTHFQAEHLMQGKWRRFTIGKYKVLERLGSGGMGSVFLCEHRLMRCLRAIKVLPTAKAQDEAALSRFYREARAVAAIDHPNIVHAYDIDQDESLHFLVMEYVDGASLQEIVKKSGPLPVLRACHYIRQSAIGLDHAHRAGLVHRDIKPGNILVDRGGAVKILDMGLARFFNDEEDILTRKFDENVLGTADYLAPEQAVDSHTVDIRADIYSLGATFYTLLTGRTPFGEGTVAQKLLWHQSRHPRPVRELRVDVPVELDALIRKMMAKDPADRYATPAEVAEALVPFTQTPIGPPPEAEMPRLSPAATGRVGCETGESDATAVSRPETPRAVKGTGSSGSDDVSFGRPPTRPMPAPTSAPSAPGAGQRASSPVIAVPQTPITPIPRRPVMNPTTQSAPAPAAAVAPTAEAEPEEDFAWQRLAGETRKAVGTDTRSQGRNATQPPVPGARKAATREKGMALAIVGLMVAGAAVVVLAGAAAWLYYLFTLPPGGPQARPKLTVSAKDAGRPGVYRSVQAALRVAQANDVIELADDSLEENLLVEFKNGQTSEVTVQAVPGRQVVWRSAKKDPKDSLIRLSGASFFRLKGEGITFDGDLGAKGKVNDLIVVTSSADGVTLEGAQFKNFGRSAVCVINAAGNAENPIRLLGLSALTPPAEKEGSVVFLDARPDAMKFKQVDYIEISDIQAPGMEPKQVIHAENGALGGKYAKGVPASK